ncbi:MAG: carbohydrate ABC transporter permease [Spirochaetaceae bacterium]|jgi:putative aldouronate transport system permease protein|nr:carbohydrate ABC transporter permease [Spirochaetaceae bacterium]
MMQKRRVRKTMEDWVVDILIYLFLGLVFFATAYPFFLSLVLSFNDGLDAAKGGIYLWPRIFTLDNYRAFFTDEKWIRGFAVTVLRTLLGTVVTTLFTGIVAYGLSYENLIGKKLYMGIAVFCLYFSGGLIPYYMTLNALGLLNKFLVYIIPQGLNLFYAIVAVSFFKSLPKELHESATIDGGGEMLIFFRIILPVSKPLLATIAIFTGVAHWSSWFDSAFFIQTRNLRTLGYLLMEVINRSNLTGASAVTAAMASAHSTITPLSIQVTAMVITVLPIMLIYPFLQKYFVTGLTVGSVKG